MMVVMMDFTVPGDQGVSVEEIPAQRGPHGVGNATQALG